MHIKLDTTLAARRKRRASAHNDRAPACKCTGRASMYQCTYRQVSRMPKLTCA
jgi:hypothetical protein